MSVAEPATRRGRVARRALRPVRASVPPLRRRPFWTVQVLVLLIAAVHTFIETALHFDFPEPLYLIPTSLFFVPVVYAAVAFGVRGSTATALWSIVLTLPNLVFLHEGLERLGIIWQLGLLLAVGVFVGLRVDRERASRAEVEARELALEASEERYRDLFDKAAEAVIVIAPDGTVEEANEAAARLVGADGVAMIGRPIGDLLGSDVADALAQDAPPGGPVPLPRASRARQRWVEVLASRPLVEPDGRRHRQAMVLDVTDRTERQRGLEGYARRVVAAREEERRRIGRELHDGPLQSLMVVARLLDQPAASAIEPSASAIEPSASAIDPSAAAGGADVRVDARDLVERTTEELRGMSRTLRPSILDDLGLVAALRSEAAALARRSGLTVRSGTLGGPRSIAPEAEIMLLRVTQEALHNVERHARASTVGVRLAFAPSCVWLVIRDDGVGPGAIPSVTELLDAGHLGVVGMQERARLAGADFELRSGRRGGTTVVVRLPQAGSLR